MGNDGLQNAKPDYNYEGLVGNNINKTKTNPPQLRKQNTFNIQNPKNQNINQNKNLQNNIFNPQQSPEINKSNSNPTQNFLMRTNTTATQKFKYHLTSKMLKDAFYTYAIDNSYLNKSRFNDALESLFRFPIPEMHYTFLTEKIYYIIDDSGDEKIQEEEFMQLSHVLSSKEYRLRLSMMAMMTTVDKNRDYIEVNEIKDFFFKSFIYGYKHLIWQVQKSKNEFTSKNLPIVSQQQIELWAERYEFLIKSYIDKDLRENGIDPYKTMDFDTFKNWIVKDHSLYLQYGSKTCVIATSLVKIEEIGFNV